MKKNLILTTIIFLFLSGVYAQTPLNAEMYLKGKQDAQKYYKKYKTAAAGTLIISTIGTGFNGLIPAIACSSTPPHDIYLDYPDASLIQNHDYYMGYVTQAKKIKSKRVWINYGVGTVINVIWVTLFINSIPHVK